MLLQLNIKNFALIENLTLNFAEGFNVLTGETGAGKSILIDAINYVLGSKFNKDFIRTGESSTFVEAIFTVDTENTKKLLSSMQIEYDDLIIISRESFSTGKSIIKINGKSIIVSTLKQISETLLDIHGQHENVHLLDSSSHINYMDDFCGDELQKHIEEYTVNFNKINELKQKIQSLRGRDQENEKFISYLKYQIDEIDNSKLKVGEDEELQERYELLTNAEKISKTLNKSYQLLYNGEDEAMSIYDSIDSIIKELRSIESKAKVAKKIADSLQETYYSVEQIISELRDIKDDYYFDMDELSDINTRIYEIGKLKKKYGSTIEEILGYRDKISKDYDETINKEEIIEKYKKELIKFEKKCYEIAADIHNVRLKFAEILEVKIKEELKYIGMANSIFKVSIDEEENLKSNGFDKVQFMISTNPGEPLKPLDKIASGGELSRIMLALKTIFIDRDMVPAVIFDEIDTGISGAIAQRVAEKMYLISCRHQVFCITHLPQIATMSDNHFNVYKEVLNEKTYTNVRKLSSEEKTYEISRMIGGAKVTEVTLNNAKQLIDMAENIKKSIHN